MAKKHYAVLFKYVQAWEDEFWSHHDPEGIVTAQGRFTISLMLFKRLNPLYASVLDGLLADELGKINPMWGAITDLCPKTDLQNAELSLLARLKEDDSPLYEGGEEGCLRERAALVIQQHTAYMSEMLARICSNKEAICDAFFGGEDFGRIVGMDADGGDCHHEGRSTCIVITQWGRFVYKPHTLRIDGLFGGLVKRYFADVVRAPKIIARSEGVEEYGFAEFLEHSAAGTDGENADLQTVASEDALARDYFWRLGGTVALLHAFGSKDFHCENLIRCEGFPALVDLETVFGAPEGAVRSQSSQPDGTKEKLFLDDIAHSLVQSGVLPKLTAGEEYSFLLSKGEHTSLPLVAGKLVDVRDYLPEFERGFDEVYDRVVACRDDILHTFEDDERLPVRLLVRNTQNYADVLYKFLYHREALASRERSEYVLSRVTFDMGENAVEQGRALAAAERQAIARGDIPLFYVCGCDLCDDRINDDGTPYRVVIKDFSDMTMPELLRDRMSRLGPSEKEFELAIIRRSLEVAHVKVPIEAPVPAVWDEGEVPADFDDLCIAEASRIFDYLKSRRITSPSGGVAWMDHVKDSCSFGTLSAGFSMGRAGIGLFLAELAFMTGDADVKGLFDEIMEGVFALPKLLQESKAARAALPKILGLTEFGGVLRVYDLVYRYTGDATYSLAADELASLLAQTDLSEALVDLYGGMSGALSALCAPDAPRSVCRREAAEVLAQAIVSKRTFQTPSGILGWDTLDKNRLMSGMGHGLAGIGLALHRASVVLDDPVLEEHARAAYDFERGLYCDRLGTWPDFRDTSVADVAMHGLCSGAPGIGLSCLGLEGCEDMFEKALDYTVTRPLSMRDHLCCGNAAVVEFLLESSRVLGRPDLRDEARARLWSMMKRKDCTGGYQFMPAGYENVQPLNLFMGVSGMGHVLLRAVRPDLACIL